MSNFNELDVYKTSYDLSIQIFRLTEKMSRTFKYTLGEKLNNNAIALLLSIYKANSNKEKRYEELQTGRECAVEIRLLFRLAKDLNLISISRLAVMNDMLDSISKQFYGWQKSSFSPQPTKPESQNHPEQNKYMGKKPNTLF
jgi:S23 ribosomal protein.